MLERLLVDETKASDVDAPENAKADGITVAMMANLKESIVDGDIEMGSCFREVGVGL